MPTVNSKIINSWKRTQDNGKILYEKFPQYNLATKGRTEVLKFKQFCAYFGKVLDVGSGPVVPYYLEDIQNASKTFGVDPLISNQSTRSEITLIKAVGENLPFKNDYFDTISFATSFDHVINPEATLIETKRVLSPKGHVIFWVEKDLDKPSIMNRGINKIKRILKVKKPTIQPDESLIKQQQTIESLENIEDCADKFHLRHIRDKEFLQMAKSSGFKLILEEDHTEFYSTFLKFQK
jgi:ubiquinone/menaquinone biosynthesis C-methylase UbiE